ncbi:hypothetical protein C8034_v010727 [Colletotrichum sidae]|uniref:Uncharacterized protein n=3 Tax=Colletotrichum orbiculare species complex TaxID=2707354 RepID=N4VM95_COLOR|nr:hypothetical protein Cob_v000447 [Colletotrichum orbiculare MAFF 240422]TDZ44687.1 hypothetical protein CTRI78_v009457 [Colletotrichum trifolii]TEA18698.1 hypothetical protein C8034_v010727 [Colletotrichum sidae]
MTNSPQSPSTKSTRSSTSFRDTGFPEPFNGDRNTTLPHPDADLSPNAVISQDDLNSNRAMARTRRSFLQKHRRTISHGVITPQMAAMYSQATDSTAALDHDAPFGASQSSLPTGRISKDGSDSVLSHNGGELSPVTSEQGRKAGLLKKLGWRK